MNRKIKLIILLIPVILLSTGCSASYTIQIKGDSIKESLTIEETYDKAVQNAYFNAKGTLDDYRYNSTYVDNYIKQMQSKYKSFYINQENFSRDNLVIKNILNSSGYTYYLRNDKDYYQKNNLLVNNITRDSLIINDNNIILHLDNIPSNLVEKIDNINIIVTTDLPVVSNNADSVEDNKYTWNFDKANYLTKSVSLYIERPKKEDDTKKNNTQKNNNSKSHGPAFTIIIMIGVYLAIIIAVINFFNKKKKLF